MAVILSARRTAVVPKGGAFGRLSIEDLAVPVALACLADAGVSAIDELICANAIGPGGNPARRIALAAGWGDGVAGLTIDRQCAGGLDALLLAQAMVDSGQADLVLAGGVESYSRRPLRFVTDPDGAAPMAYDEAPFTPWPDRNPGMTEAAAALAAAIGIPRQDQEDWAVASHAKALARTDWPEIVPVAGQGRDTFPRQLTHQLLSRLPAMDGSITKATTAVAADAAAFCLVAADRFGTARSLKLVTGKTLGADPLQPGLAPVPAIKAALKQAKALPCDLVQAEIMEAYAVQAMACVQMAKIDPDCVNPAGGGLARGHPIGASGAILAVRLFHDLTHGLGLAAIASAGGVGSAVVFERSGA